MSVTPPPIHLAVIGELQRIEQSLEAGNLPLKESIELHRRGLELHAACKAPAA